MFVIFFCIILKFILLQLFVCVSGLYLLLLDYVTKIEKSKLFSNSSFVIKINNLNTLQHTIPLFGLKCFFITILIFFLSVFLTLNLVFVRTKFKAKQTVY